MGPAPDKAIAKGGSASPGRSRHSADRRSRSGLAGALFTDLYELSMGQAYDAEGMHETAVFEVFFRRLPDTRNYLMAAGLDDVLDYLEGWRFREAELTYLRSLGTFKESYLARLAEMRFTGDVYAVPEGTIVFEHEPLIQVVAPLPQAQLLETLVLNRTHFQSIAATKAARLGTAAGGRLVVDFGSRRAQGLDAALAVGRACYLAGLAGTSNVQAGYRFGVPLFGTMAHSYIQAHDDERDAFEAFTRQFPETTLLVDTYDTLEGVRHVIDMARAQGKDFRVRAVRLDSGNLAELARQSRRMLDDAGLTDVRIIASSGLDEYRIAELTAAGVPIDGFGVGSKLAVSDDVPFLDMAYKLVEYAGRPRTKLSSDKTIYPSRKQFFRTFDAGRMAGDTLARWDETQPGEALLRQVMANGERLHAGRVTLERAREHAAGQLEALPERIRALHKAESPYPVTISEALADSLGALSDARGMGKPG